MLETETVHLGAGLDGIAPVCEADECETLGQTRLSVLGQEHTSDPTESLEHVAQLLLLRQLRNLCNSQLVTHVRTTTSVRDKAQWR